MKFLIISNAKIKREINVSILIVNMRAMYLIEMVDMLNVGGDKWR